MAHEARHDVEVLEAADRPGGRMQLLERRGDRVDVGAQFFHSSYSGALQLMDELGLAAKRRTISAGTQFARPESSKFLLRHDWDFPRLLGPGGTASLTAFGLRYLVFGRRFPMSQIVRSIPAYDEVSVAEIVRGAQRRHLDYVVRPICFGETVAYPEHTSLYHYLHQLRLTLYTRFVALSSGVSSLTDALARRVSVRYETPAHGVIWEESRVPGVELEDGTACKADHVIVATTPDAGARILPDEMDGHGWGNAIYPPGQYQGVIDFREKAEALAGISFVGSPYGGVHMEAAILTAKRAVARVERGMGG